MAHALVDQLIETCLRETRAEGLSELGLANVRARFEHCLRAGVVKDAIADLLRFAYFLERQRSLPVPARQILDLARSGQILLARTAESRVSSNDVRRAKQRRAILGFA